MTSDRDRLIELYKKAFSEWLNSNDTEISVCEFICDHFIANGVIVPPIKLGDTIFVIPNKVNFKLNVMSNLSQNNRVYEQVIDHIQIWKDDYMLYTCDGLYAVRSKSYKDIWFLTKEEAEQKLKELKSNANNG